MQAKAVFLALIIATVSLSGCFGDQTDEVVVPEVEPNNDGTFVTDKSGMAVNEPLLDMEFFFSDVGEDGPEPSLGITSSGCIFFIAMEKPMRSCDGGQTWENMADITQAPFTSDPYGWVDPVTD